MLKSFYTLEMYIQPGGGRYALMFVASSIAEIQAALRQELANKFNLTFLLDYGEDLRLCTYHHCQIVDDINLLPYLSVEIEGYGTFAIDKHQQVTPKISAQLSELLCESVESLDVVMFVNWSQLAIPSLLEPLLMPGEATICNDHYMGIKIDAEQIAKFAAAQGNPDELLDLANVVYYGWTDLEGGEEIDDIEDYFQLPEDGILPVVFR